jgi:hypothetical protein
VEAASDERTLNVQDSAKPVRANVRNRHHKHVSVLLRRVPMVETRSGACNHCADLVDINGNNSCSLSRVASGLKQAKGTTWEMNV